MDPRDQDGRTGPSGRTDGADGADGPEPLLRRGHQGAAGRVPASLRRVAAVARVPPRRAVALAGASLLAGLVEAAALLLVVRVAVAVAAGEGAVTGTRLHVELSVGAACWLGAGLVLVRTGLAVAVARWVAGTAADTQRRLRTATFASFLDASWSLQSAERQGRLQELLSTHVNRIATGVSMVANGIATALALAALLAAALVVDPLAATVALAAIVLLAAVVRPLTRMSRRQSAAFADANLGFVETVHEAVDLALEVRTFGVAGAYRATGGRRAAAAATAYRTTQLLGRVVPALYQGAALALVLAGLAAVAAIDPDDVTALGAAVVILVRALASAQSLQTAYHQLNDVVPFVDQLFGQLDRYAGAAVRDGGRPLDRVEHLELRAVSFAYRPGRPVLRDVDLAVPRGEAVGVVGPSGGGKSTLVQLLLRLRPPDRGRYLVNGEPADEFALADWCRRVAFVPQDVRLPGGTASEAVRFLRDDVDDAAIADAAAAAGIADEVASWPEGWSTTLGPRGMALSGGQRQRLAIARALAGRPDVLVLDEPTSALDAVSEAAVQATLRRLHGTVTLVLVAHRLSTLAVCDRLVVIEGGRVAACGPPGEVLQSSAYYRDAVSRWQLL